MISHVNRRQFSILIRQAFIAFILDRSIQRAVFSKTLLRLRHIFILVFLHLPKREATCEVLIYVNA